MEGLLQGGRHRFELAVHLLERRQRGKMRDRVEMGDRADHQDGHRAIDRMQRICRVVEEEDVGEA